MHSLMPVLTAYTPPLCCITTSSLTNQPGPRHALTSSSLSTTMPHLLRTIQHSSYYSSSKGALVRRDWNRGKSNALSLSIALAVLFGVSTFVLLYFYVKTELRARKHRAQGQGVHLRTGSLRRRGAKATQDLESGSRSRLEGRPDTLTSWTTLSAPDSAHMRYSESYVSTGPARHPAEWSQATSHIRPQPAYHADGFQPAPRNGAPTESEYLEGR